MPTPAGKSDTQTLLEAPSTSVERVPSGAGPQRLHCGAVFTEKSIQYLTEFWIANRQEFPGLIPAFEYVSCIDGPRAGQAWHKLLWLPPNAASITELFEIGPVPCLISRPTQKALKNKTVDFSNSQFQIT